MQRSKSSTEKIRQGAKVGLRKRIVRDVVTKGEKLKTILHFRETIRVDY